ncbi:type I-E CRISPR-associated protein Cas6/Cse3/CasE [Serratia microhaemolytica]|uniref:type I-E CRISPR-associated protein Cas6/Cse3/CasE n=1 Tax=Serratia microhaemolytica TaxID=2675110 RepID=UPI000FDDD444|nr:type I-E CRISPR-associated protein Cas6/Cse3/CasE [Serratia microhaemolytica]
MFLTKLMLNPHSREVQRDLANPYELHRTLVRAFVADAKAAPRRFLWRLESNHSWQQPILLVQSAFQANWAPIIQLSHYLDAEIQEKTVEPERWLITDHTFRFRLQANPTVSRHGKRWGLMKEEEQLGWLARQGERNGFLAMQTQCSGMVMLQARKGQNKLSVLSVTFDGYLRVVDPELLCAAMSAGIGPAKSLGCGLLTLGRG